MMQDGTRKRFYIERYARDESGVYAIDGEKRSLEDDFGVCRYKSMTGINARGKQKGLYVETYAESDAARVWMDSNARKEQVSSTLTLCFFGSDPLSVTDLSVGERIKIAEDSWCAFCDWIENHLLLWYDEYRQRKALFYLAGAVEPASDVIKGTPYLQCAVKLTNVFGQSFGKDDTTIEDWLANGGKEG